MKHHFLNPEKVVEFWINEPTSIDKDLPFSTEHGWQIVIVTDNMRTGDQAIKIDMESEEQCMAFAEPFGFVKLV